MTMKVDAAVFWDAVLSADDGMDEWAKVRTVDLRGLLFYVEELEEKVKVYRENEADILPELDAAHLMLTQVGRERDRAEAALRSRNIHCVLLLIAFVAVTILHTWELL